MHKLLKRQLKKTNATIDKKFLELVNQAYIDADEDRKLLERSLEISSKEMRELYNNLKKTSQIELKKSENRYNRLVHELRHQYFFYTYDKNFIFTYISDSVKDILGYDAKSVIGTNFTNYYTKEDINANSIKLSEQIVQGDKIEPRVVSVYHKNGSIYYLEVDSYPIFNDKKEVVEIEGIAKDITQQHKAQLELAYLSNHDALTGLMNRYSLYNQIEYVIHEAKRNKKSFSLFYIDLDNFKLVNDTFGHNEGDKLLKDFSKSLKKHLRQNDILARIGGDEFVLVYTDTHPNNNYELAQNLLQNISNDITKRYKNLHVSASIGISSYPKDGQTVDALLKSADTAMYIIKQNGKNNFSIH